MAADHAAGLGDEALQAAVAGAVAISAAPEAAQAPETPPVTITMSGQDVLDAQEAVRAMKQTGTKIGGMSRIPPSFLLEVARVREFGSKKYQNWDWLNGHPVTELLDAIDRHTMAMVAGEDVDSESGCHHAAHIACCSMFLIEGFYAGWQNDDREHMPRQLLTPEAFAAAVAAKAWR